MKLMPIYLIKEKMTFDKPIFGTLIRRYKRFFSEVMLDSGELVVAHTPNTGPMTSCWEVGMRCVLTESSNPKRKLKYTLQLTYNGASYIIVNTHLPNLLVKEALQNKQIDPMSSYDTLLPEFTVNTSRFDFLLSNSLGLKALLEIKNASTIDNKGLAIFPDTVSTRALKHVKELTELQTKTSFKCILLFLVAREDCIAFRPAKEFMPEYLDACREAQNKGVTLIAAQWKVSPLELTFGKLLPVILD